MAGLALGALFVVISSNIQKNITKYILTVYIGINVFNFTLEYFIFNGLELPKWISVIYMTEALEGGLFYLYVKSLVTPNFHLERKDVVHLLPYAGWLLLFLQPQQSISYLGAFYVAFHYELLSLYLIAAFRLLPNYQQFIRGHFSSIDDEDLGWLYKLIVIYIISSVFLFFTRADYAFTLYSDPSQTEFLIGNTFFFAIHFYLIVKGYLQPRFLSENKPKYAHSGLGREKCELWWQKLNDHMEAAEPFTNEKLTLAQLAQNIGLTTHQLSQTLNTMSGQAFYEYVNTHRAKKARQLLEGDRSLPIIEVGIEAGFSNTTTFYKYFKMLSSKTPLQYQKSLTI